MTPRIKLETNAANATNIRRAQASSRPSAECWRGGQWLMNPERPRPGRADRQPQDPGGLRPRGLRAAQPVGRYEILVRGRKATGGSQSRTGGICPLDADGRAVVTGFGPARPFNYRDRSAGFIA